MNSFCYIYLITVCMRDREGWRWGVNFHESALSFHHVDPGDGTLGSTYCPLMLFLTYYVESNNMHGAIGKWVFKTFLLYLRARNFILFGNVSQSTYHYHM